MMCLLRKIVLAVSCIAAMEPMYGATEMTAAHGKFRRRKVNPMPARTFEGVSRIDFYLMSLLSVAPCQLWESASTGFFDAARNAGTREARRPNTNTIATTHTTSAVTRR